MAYAGRYLTVHKGFVSYLAGYKTYIARGEYDDWRHIVAQTNQSLAPEIVGMLIGRAEGYYEKQLCEVCNLEIKEEDLVKRDAPSFPPHNEILPVHIACFEKLKPTNE